MTRDNLTDAERQLLSVLLENAGTRLSRAICSDVPAEAAEGVALAERQQMAVDYEQWNSGGRESTPFNAIADWAWLKYFAARIRNSR